MELWAQIERQCRKGLDIIRQGLEDACRSSRAADQQAKRVFRIDPIQYIGLHHARKGHGTIAFGQQTRHTNEFALYDCRDDVDFFLAARSRQSLRKQANSSLLSFRLPGGKPEFCVFASGICQARDRVQL